MQELSCLLGNNILAIDYPSIELGKNLFFINFGCMMKQALEGVLAIELWLIVAGDGGQHV